MCYVKANVFIDFRGSPTTFLGCSCPAGILPCCAIVAVGTVAVAVATVAVAVSTIAVTFVATVGTVGVDSGAVSDADSGAGAVSDADAGAGAVLDADAGAGAVLDADSADFLLRFLGPLLRGLFAGDGLYSDSSDLADSSSDSSDADSSTSSSKTGCSDECVPSMS